MAELRSTSATAFLFNASDPTLGSFYGEVCERAALSALCCADPEGHTHSRILRGDLLLALACTRIVKISNNQSAGSNLSRISQTLEIDQALFVTMLWDFADAISADWHTTEPATLPALLVGNEVYALAFPTLCPRIRVKMDKRLKKRPWYLGAHQIDFANPIQSHLYANSLIDGAYVSGGAVHVAEDAFDEPQAFIGGSKEFRPNGEVLRPTSVWLRSRPSFPATSSTSPRGALSIARYRAKRGAPLSQKIAQRVYELGGGEDRSFTFEPWQRDHAIEIVEVHEGKLLNYLLNEEHEQGKGKAKFLRTALGISKEDWRYLSAQLADGITNAEPEAVRITNHGIMFEAVMGIRGINGKTATIRTVWALAPGQIAKLVTLIPDKKDEALEVDAPADSIILGKEGRAKWEALLSLAIRAGDSAALAAVPTPMQVRGSQAQMEGLCGWATVRIADARRGFGRWLLKTGSAYRDNEPGATISCNVSSQSVDRASAYAHAVARILRRNGIKCEVKVHLD